MTSGPEAAALPSSIRAMAARHGKPSGWARPPRGPSSALWPARSTCRSRLLTISSGQALTPAKPGACEKNKVSLRGLRAVLVAAPSHGIYIFMQDFTVFHGGVEQVFRPAVELIILRLQPTEVTSRKGYTVI